LSATKSCSMMPSEMALVLGDGAAGPPRYCGDALQ